MKKLGAWLGCVWLGLLGVVAAGETNEFKMAIEGESCVVHAYQAEPGIVQPAWFDSKPKSVPQWQLAIVFHQSNVAQHLSNDEIRSLHEAPLDDATINKMRAGLGKMYEMASPSAAENPSKGMTQTLDRAFVIESPRGKCLLFHTSAQLVGQKNPGHVYGALNFVDGAWKLGKTGFKISNLATVSDEFLKLKADGKIKAEPLDSLR